PTEHATIGHKPGEGFSLATRPATRSSKGPENLGRGSTKFMFDMKKGDKPGQTTIFDKLEAKPETVSKQKAKMAAAVKAVAKLQGMPQKRANNLGVMARAAWKEHLNASAAGDVARAHQWKEHH